MNGLQTLLAAVEEKIMERGLLFGTIDEGHFETVSLECSEINSPICIHCQLSEREADLTQSEKLEIIGIVKSCLLTKAEDAVARAYIKGADFKLLLTLEK